MCVMRECTHPKTPVTTAAKAKSMLMSANTVPVNVCVLGEGVCKCVCVLLGDGGGKDGEIWL